MGRRLWENMVTAHIFSPSSLQCRFVPSCPRCAALRRLCLVLQGGSEGGWIWLPQSLRWRDSFPIQKEEVSMFIYAKTQLSCCGFTATKHFIKFHRIVESYGQVRLGMVRLCFLHICVFSKSTTMTWVDTTEQLRLILSRCATSMWWWTVQGVWRTRIWNQTDWPPPWR